MIRIRRFALALATLALATSGSARALPALGLGSHTIFLTSTAYDGDLGGVAGADALCQSHAESGALTASLGRVWRALISVDGVVDARDRLAWHGPVYDVTGLLVTDDPGSWPWAEDGTSTLDVDENGDPPPDAFVWTGSTVQGVAKGAGFDCAGWTSSSSAVDGWAGQSGYFGDDNWIDSFSSGCSDAWYSLYCVSKAEIFADGFETGKTCLWSERVGISEVC